MKIPWKMKWQPLQYSCAWKSMAEELVGYSSWGPPELYHSIYTVKEACWLS